MRRRHNGRGKTNKHPDRSVSDTGYAHRYPVSDGPGGQPPGGKGAFALQPGAPWGRDPVSYTHLGKGGWKGPGRVFPPLWAKKLGRSRGSDTLWTARPLSVVLPFFPQLRWGGHAGAQHQAGIPPHCFYRLSAPGLPGSGQPGFLFGPVSQPVPVHLCGPGRGHRPDARPMRSGGHFTGVPSRCV